jgi:glutathione S-transferase
MAYSNNKAAVTMKYLLVSLFCAFLSMSNGLTLYGHPGTRSPLCNWGAYEVGVEVEMGDLSKNPHPFGQIPCLTDDDDVLVFESGAILHYLHDKTKDSLTKSRAAAVTSWITWANASLDPICFLETPDGKGKGLGRSSFSEINL